MKCIMIRLRGYDVLDVGDDSYHIAANVFTRTEIVDMVGKMLCTQLAPKENPVEAFSEFVLSRIGYVIDRRNAHLADPEEYEAIWTDDEKDRVLEYFVRRYKCCKPYIPDAGELKFMASVWHEDANFVNNAVCVIAEFTHFDDTVDEHISQIKIGNLVREAIARDRDDCRPMFAVFT